jgi:hypothetical protein
LAGNDTAIIGFSDQQAAHFDSHPSTHVTEVTVEVLGYNYSSSTGIALHVPASPSPGTARLSSGQSVSLNTSDVLPRIWLTDWDLTAEHWEAPQNISDSLVVAAKHNTTHRLSSVEFWLDIPGLAKVSGLGFYASNFTWQPSARDAVGVYVFFSEILDAVVWYINSERLPPLNYNHTAADFSTFL